MGQHLWKGRLYGLHTVLQIKKGRKPFLYLEMKKTKIRMKHCGAQSRWLCPLKKIKLFSGGTASFIFHFYFLQLLKYLYKRLQYLLPVISSKYWTGIYIFIIRSYNLKEWFHRDSLYNKLVYFLWGFRKVMLPYEAVKFSAVIRIHTINKTNPNINNTNIDNIIY